MSGLPLLEDPPVLHRPAVVVVVRLRPEDEDVDQRRAEEELLHPLQRAEPGEVAEQAHAVVPDREAPRFAARCRRRRSRCRARPRRRARPRARRGCTRCDSGSNPIIFAATASIATWSALARMKFFTTGIHRPRARARSPPSSRPSSRRSPGGSPSGSREGRRAFRGSRSACSAASC